MDLIIAVKPGYVDCASCYDGIVTSSNFAINVVMLFRKNYYMVKA